MSVVPSAEMRSFTALCAPVPRATTEITADTPITMPSIVSSERSLLARSALMATLIVSPNSIVLPRAAARVSAAGTAGRATGAAGTTSTRSGRQAGHAHALAHAIVLLLPLRLQRDGREQCDLLTFLHTADHLGVIEVAGAEHHDARLERLVLRYEDESRARTRARAAHFGRRELQRLSRLRAGPHAAVTTLAVRTCLTAARLARHSAAVRHHLLPAARACLTTIDAEGGIDRARLLAERAAIGALGAHLRHQIVELLLLGRLLGNGRRDRGALGVRDLDLLEAALAEALLRLLSRELDVAA